MTLNTTTKIAAGLFVLGLLLGAAAAKYTMPPKIVEKRVEVTKEVYKEDKNVKTVVTETDKPDGTIEKVTTTEDKSTIEDSKKSQEKQNVMADNRDQVMLNGMAGYDFHERKDLYGLEIEKRVLLNVYIGVWGLTNGAAGVSVGMSF